MPFAMGLGIKLALAAGAAAGAVVGIHQHWDTIEVLWNDRENIIEEIKQVFRERQKNAIRNPLNEPFNEPFDSDATRKPDFEVDYIDSDDDGDSDAKASTLRRRHVFTMPTPNSSGTLPSVSDSEESEYSEYSVIASGGETDGAA